MEGKHIVFLVIGLLMFLVLFGTPIADSLGGKFNFLKDASGKVGEYVFGIKAGSSSFAGTDLTSYAYLVIFMMLWLIFFVSFGDIIGTFSTFDESIAWIIATALSIIVGLLGVIGGVVGVATKWFVWAGTFAIYLALATAVVAFLLVNFGLSSISGWVMKRKLARDVIRGKKGASEAADAVSELRLVDKAFKSKEDDSFSESGEI